MEARFTALAKLFENEEVAKKLLSYTPEEAAVVLREQYQLEFTVEELKDVAAGILAATQEGSEELTVDQLENVAGGGKGAAYYHGYYLGKTCQVAAVIIGVIAAATGAW